jgi:hypothetical protein
MPEKAIENERQRDRVVEEKQIYHVTYVNIANVKQTKNKHTHSTSNQNVEIV